METPKQETKGAIREIVIGRGGESVTVGGQTALPFHGFEGAEPKRRLIGMEVWDIDPQNIWPETVYAPFASVAGDCGAWSAHCVKEFGAPLIQVTLAGTDPNGADLDTQHAVEAVKKVLAAVNVPVAVWGTANFDKDRQVLAAVAEQITDTRLMIGPVQEENHKDILPAIIKNGHIAVNSSPIDINLAKQLNVLAGNLGLPDDRILMDPTTGGLGYGLEYTYSVMERARLAGLMHGDAKLQFPLYCYLGQEAWKVKEVTLDDAKLGDVQQRGINMETVAAVSLLLTGADLLIVRHPETRSRLVAFLESMGSGE